MFGTNTKSTIIDNYNISHVPVMKNTSEETEARFLKGKSNKSGTTMMLKTSFFCLSNFIQRET